MRVEKRFVTTLISTHLKEIVILVVKERENGEKISVCLDFHRNTVRVQNNKLKIKD